ncbi:hypothetical protein QZH41_020185, partial [Actinostola sp. cb2023]
MPRPKTSCITVQSTIGFPARKTRSQGKIEPKFEVGLASPRKRAGRAKVVHKPPVSPKKKKNNKGHAEDAAISDGENMVPSQSTSVLKTSVSPCQTNGHAVAFSDSENTVPSHPTPVLKTSLSPSKRNGKLQVQNSPPCTPLVRKPLFGACPTPCTPKGRSVLSLARAQVLIKYFLLFVHAGLCYSAVKKALHTGAPKSLLCREKEQETIKSFLHNHLTNKKPGSLYISGAPGTGKTACLTKVMQELEDEMEDCPMTFVNCMTLQHSHAIFSKIIENLEFEENVCARDSQKVLEKKFTSPGPMRILILDELDQLETKNQDVLYTMFEWPSLPKSKLILIGIANALDLTDRILPRLQARPKCKPGLLHFSPYTRNQIATILQDRVAQTKGDAVILDTPAIQFCARKVAAVAGDMRKALDICRRAVEVVEADVRKQHILQPVIG